MIPRSGSGGDEEFVNGLHHQMCSLVEADTLLVSYRQKEFLRYSILTSKRMALEKW